MSKRFTAILNRDSISSTDDLPSASELEKRSVKSGWLHKRGGGKKSIAWKKRWFVLEDQNFYYFKTEKDKRPKGVIGPLSMYKIENGEDGVDQFEFHLVPKKSLSRIYIIYANSREEKENWMQALKSAVLGGSKVTKQTVAIEEKLRRNCYDIPPQDLEWVRDEDAILGKGGSGIVKKGLWLKTTEVAVKALNNIPEFIDREEMIGFYKEIETLSQLRHPNIVPMFGYCKKDNYLCLVTEYVKGGNLSEALHNLNTPISFKLKLELCMSICRGMVYLHNKNIIHRDLKPGNILVENLQQAKVKVCDFGLSTIFKGKSDMDTTTDTYGSPAYAAPELTTSNHSFKVDVFSFGVIVWEIYARKRVWDHIKHSIQITDLVAQGERMPLIEGCPLNFLISKCWEQDPKNRPSFSQIYEELEKLQKTLVVQSEDFYSLDSNDEQPEVSLEDQILDCFGSRESMYWEEFSQNLVDIFSTSSSVIEKLKFVLVDGNSVVHKKYWKNFIRWFTPLSQPDYYQTGKVSGQKGMIEDGYQIEEIADIVGQKWFYGFLSPQKAKEILMERDVGSFLFRFSSSTEKCYTLSVNYGGPIPGHWRITTEKSGGYPIFRIDGKPYNSLNHIVEAHSFGGNPLSGKANENGVSKRCFLKEGVDRNVALKNGIYEDMYD